MATRRTASTEKVGKAEGNGFDRWQENYNAACAYAVPTDGGRRPQAAGMTSWRKRRSSGLPRAAACSDSGYLAGRRAWLLSEDPDLDGLRGHPRFKWFEAMYFPRRTDAR